ncbi:MAG: flagellar biosynthetic protein FliO [Ferruginibacter sp.]|nr:flagellar biosynthetic protein FliO [Rhodoferax sp.]
MGQTLMVVVLFVAVIAMLPLAIKWIQRRAQVGGAAASGNARVVSAVGVGPQQRVVTVEVGPEGARTWLVLGVTAQSITCLHTVPMGSSPTPSTPYAVVAAKLQEGVDHV